MRLFSLFVLIVSVAAPAFAQTPGRVALDALVSEALAKNPAIAAADRRLDAARQRPAQERSLPDPMISAGWTASGNPLPGAGLGTEPIANIGLMVSQAFPYPGKLALKASMAARDADAAARDVDEARLDVTARVQQAYYRLAYTWAAGDVLARNRRLLETLLEVSENRYAVGQAAQQDVIKAQTELSIIELQLERIRSERAAREGELNALLARPSTTPVGRPEDPVLTPFEASLGSLIAAAADHAPALARGRILIDRSQIAVASARTDYKPDFAVSAGYAYMGAMPPMYEARIDVTVPLQRAKRAAAVAEQVSAAGAARSGYEAARLDLQNRIQQDYEAATTASRLARLYRDTVLPQARLALESSMASYQTGGVDFLSVMTSFGTVLQYEMTFYEELTSYHTAVSRIEQDTGAPLGPSHRQAEASASSASSAVESSGVSR